MQVLGALDLSIRYRPKAERATLKPYCLKPHLEFDAIYKKSLTHFI